MSPSEDECRQFLETFHWNNIPTCPYCTSTNSTPMPKEKRYHCNFCFTSYSVTVGTIFHKTRIPLLKWFQAISILLNSTENVSVRKLSQQIDVNKNTASYIIKRIKENPSSERPLLQAIDAFMKKGR